jgi:hypothetical protein
MADRIRREKDVVQRTVSKFLQTTTEAYTKYFEGGPTYIIYYQLNPEASTQDMSLENVHSLVGTNTPNKYKRIEDVVVYGVDAMDISNEITRRGLESTISGEFIMLPDSIKPYPGDFFTFDYDGLRDHLFRIDNVQFDKASPKKFFRINFAIWKDNAEIILGTLKEDGTYSNISGDYVFNYQNIGGEDSAVVAKADATAAEKIKLLYDGYIDKFANLFYHEDMDIFVYKGYELNFPSNVWSPYLQKFIHDNQLMNKYKKEILIEFYVNDVDERTNPAIFSDRAYRESIFRKLEVQDSNLSLENSFVGVSNYDLKLTRNLPFFHSTESYRVLRLFNDGKPVFTADVINFLHQDFYEIFLSLDNKYKLSIADLTDNDKLELIEEGKVFYTLDNNSNIAGVFLKGTGTSYSSISLNNYEVEKDPIFKIVTDYLAGNLSFTSKNKLYFYQEVVKNGETVSLWVEKDYYEEEPLNKKSGDIWLNSNGLTPVIKVYNGTIWQTISPNLIFSEVPETPTLGQYYFKKSMLSTLNNIYIMPSLSHYMLIPMLLFVLKQSIKDYGV